jgi:hypothetical protein
MNRHVPSRGHSNPARLLAPEIHATLTPSTPTPISCRASPHLGDPPALWPQWVHGRGTENTGWSLHALCCRWAGIAQTYRRFDSCSMHTPQLTLPHYHEHVKTRIHAGFSHMADEAAVYRSSRLHTINPTAACSEDTSFYWTLVSRSCQHGKCVYRWRSKGHKSRQAPLAWVHTPSFLV